MALPPDVCSFCGKREKDAEAFVSGPSVQICDECSDIVARHIAEKKAEKAKAGRKRHSKKQAKKGAAAPPLTSVTTPEDAALDFINRARKRAGRGPLDPWGAGWTAHDVVVEAKRLGWRANPRRRRKGKMKNPGSRAILRRAMRGT